MNGKTHKAVGAVTGAVVAGYKSRGQAPQNRVLETAGGVVGGVVGGKFLDLVEPATTPNHRHLAHSLVANLAALWGVTEYLEKGVEWMRTKAAEFEARALREPDPVKQVALAFLSVILRMVAGFMNGFVGGHFSHAALDSLTPAGLPLLTSGGPALSFAR